MNDQPEPGTPGPPFPPGGYYGPPAGPPGGLLPTGGIPPRSYHYLPEPGATAPPGYLTDDERTWGMLSHLLGLLVGFLGPLIVMLTKGKESPFVRDQAVEALNFQLTSLIAMFVGTIVTIVLIFVIIGLFLIPVLMAMGVAVVVFEILAIVAANQGTAYRYPVNLRMVK